MDNFANLDNVLTTSEQIGEIAGALAKAQSEILMAEKDAINPHFKSQYATLSSSIKAGKGPASKNGLAVIQASGFTEGVVTVATLLTHNSNQWFKNVLHLPVHKTDIHTIKSAVTYGRRIGYEGILGIAPGDDDDDGNTASEPPTEEQKKIKTARRKLRAKLNKALQPCDTMSQLEKRAREVKGDTYGFWEMATYVNPGETFGKVYLAHKDRVGNIEARYTEEAHKRWRAMVEATNAASFIDAYKEYENDCRRQTQENGLAIIAKAQDLGLWDDHTNKIMIDGEK